MSSRESKRGRRAIVPIASDADIRLRIEVRAGDGHTYAGEVTDVPRGGVGMRFTQTPVPQLPVGKQVVLVLSSAHLSKSLELPAIVRWREEMRGVRGYRFHFNGQAAYSREVAKEFYRIFNRRGADRVEPRLDERVEVQITALEPGLGRGALVVHLKNISASGMGILATADADYLLADVECVTVTLQLPTGDATLRLSAWIRSRALEGDSIAYALEFDSQRTQEFFVQQEAIMDYVMGRLMEELQNTVG